MYIADNECKNSVNRALEVSISISYSGLSLNLYKLQNSVGLEKIGENPSKRAKQRNRFGSSHKTCQWISTEHNEEIFTRNYEPNNYCDFGNDLVISFLSPLNILGISDLYLLTFNLPINYKLTIKL